MLEISFPHLLPLLRAVFVANMVQARHVAFRFLLYLALPFISSLTVHSLHLKLIHSDSIGSPLYPGNLTHRERLERLSYQSQLYYATVSQSSYNKEQVRPRLFTVGQRYLVELTVGTPPRGRQRTTYHLVMDTGSGMVWLHCQPCRMCWRQTANIFDPRRDSTTHTPLPCNHFLCDLSRYGWKCVNNQCSYAATYMPPMVSQGVMIADSLRFASDRGGMEFNRLFFGCGLANQHFQMSENMAGIVGLNMEPTSLAMQLGGRFAYCLPPFTNTAQPPSLLRFGDGARLRGPNVKTIPLITMPGVLRHYYLGLVDVSIGSHRIGFPPGAFAVIRSGDTYQGGFIIDTGAPITRFMSGMPFDRVKDAIVGYFRPFGLARWSLGNFQMCYRYPANRAFNAYPSMTLHFSYGVDLVVPPTNLVYKEQEGFCILIMPENGVSLFGAYQQLNYRFSFDLVNKKLSFVPANCLRDV